MANASEIPAIKIYLHSIRPLNNQGALYSRLLCRVGRKSKFSKLEDSSTVNCDSLDQIFYEMCSGPDK